MRYLELKDGWLNLDTMEKKQFGEFAIEAFNNTNNASYNTAKHFNMRPTFSENMNDWNEADFYINELNLFRFILLVNFFDKEHDIDFNYLKTDPLLVNTYSKLLPDFTKYYIENDIYYIDRYISKVLEKFGKYKVTKMQYESEWCNLYNFSNDYHNFYDFDCNGDEMPKLLLVILDMINLKCQKTRIKMCKKPGCINYFIINKNNNKYCNECSKNYKMNYNIEYNNSTKGLIHKAYRYMTSTTVFSTAEMAGFKNNAWNAYENMSEEDFVNWIKEEHSNLKIEAKKRKQKLKAGV